MNTNITLCICRTTCWNCKKEFNAAYVKWERDGWHCICSPECFSEKDKTVAAENGVIIKTLGYQNRDGDVDIYTANICPHCGKPFGNRHIKELIGREEKEIVIRKQDGSK